MAVACAFVGAALFTLVVMLGPHPVTESLDWVLHGQPNLHFLREAIKSGEFPWWNPHVGLGRPYASDLQSAVYYPLTYLYLLGETMGLSLFLGLHSMLLILGMHLLCRQLGSRGVFGLLGGLVLLVSMGFGGRLLPGHTFYFAGLSYLPMLLWAMVRLRLRPTVGWTGLLSLLLTLQFLTGHPQVFWCSTLGLGLFLVGLLVRPAQVVFWRRIPRILAGFVAALLLAGGVSAIAWLPFLDLIAEGNRQASTLEFASYGCFEPMFVFGMVTEPPVDFVINWEQNLRLGFAWTVPGLVGLCFLRNTAIRALLLMGVAALWFSFGEASWLFRLCFDYLPGASSFRMPSRINALPVLALVTAGAVFLGRSGTWAAFPKAGMAVVGFMVVGLLRGYPYEGSVVKLGLFGPMSAMLLAAGSVYLWKRRGAWSASVGTGAAAVWLSLQCVELAVAHAHFGRSYSNAVGIPTREKAAISERFRATLATAANGVPPRIMVLADMVPPNWGMRDGWAHIDSYTALFLKRPWNYLHAGFGVAPPTIRNASLSPEIYERSPFSLPNLSLDLGLDVAAGRLARAAAPVPRLWITFEPRLVSRPEEALAAVTNRLDLPREGVVETALPIPPSPLGDGSGSAEILRFRHSEIEVKCRLSHPGLLVLNEAWFPGWHTVVAGHRIESQPVNYWMRGFALPAGEHTLKLQFRPRRMVEAVALSIGSLGVGWFLIFRGGRFWRRPEALVQ